jgi:hypothetical protein
LEIQVLRSQSTPSSEADNNTAKTSSIPISEQGPRINSAMAGSGARGTPSKGVGKLLTSTTRESLVAQSDMSPHLVRDESARDGQIGRGHSSAATTATAAASATATAVAKYTPAIANVSDTNDGGFVKGMPNPLALLTQAIQVTRKVVVRTMLAMLLMVATYRPTPTTGLLRVLKDWTIKKAI